MAADENLDPSNPEQVKQMVRLQHEQIQAQHSSAAGRADAAVEWAAPDQLAIELLLFWNRFRDQIKRDPENLDILAYLSEMYSIIPVYIGACRIFTDLAVSALETPGALLDKFQAAQNYEETQQVLEALMLTRLELRGLTNNDELMGDLLAVIKDSLDDLLELWVEKGDEVPEAFIQSLTAKCHDDIKSLIDEAQLQAYPEVGIGWHSDETDITPGADQEIQKSPALWRTYDAADTEVAADLMVRLHRGTIEQLMHVINSTVENDGEGLDL